MTRPYDPDPYPRGGSALSRGFLPLALITLGVVFLLSNLIPDRGRAALIVLGLGAAFAIGRLTTGRYGYAVPAGILMAIGVYVLVHEFDIQGLRGMSSAGLFFVLLGLGFAAVYVIGLRPAEIWPLFPAVILVGLGLVLLGASWIGPLASLSWITAYWPVALVLLGAWLLLREAIPAPVRRPMATLGGLALLVYGILAAAASVAAGGALSRTGIAPGSGSAPFADTITLDQPISAGQTLTVANTSGSTTIHGGDGQTVHVVASRHFAIGGQGPDVRLTPTSSGLSLGSTTTGRGGTFFGDDGSVDYTVELPAAAAVNVQSSSGQVQVDGVSGPVDVTTTSGSVHLNDISGAVSATSTSGSIAGSQLLHVRQARATSGSISLESVFTDPAQITTTSGKVNLKLLPGSAEQLDVHSSSGSVEPQGGLQLSNGVTRRDTLSGTLGTPAAGATLDVQTQSGGVTVGQ
ncbi:MAG: DUF4097 family beta strand repeat protein [Chloroflexi bacterium]|nr:DUF4097 family beta strand repeat protein [Chloroflexota bacterium]MBV9598679.1 DUF4097 family beta strand repeat protein [Chloroflexota bacterium]